MKEFDKMKSDVDDKHRMKELEQKAEIMEEYILAIESKDSSKRSSSLLTDDESHKKKESEQEILILKELYKKIEEKAEIDKSQLLTMISHELKTPLVPIKAYAEMLEEGKFGEISEIQRKKLKVIDESSRELIQIVSNMIEYQKFSSGKIDLQKEQHDIKKMIIDAHQFFASEYDSRGMRTNSNFSKPLLISCDKQRISQLLNNLLQVAFYSIPKKKGKIIFNVWEKENEVEIYVLYNGEGLSAKDFERILSEFYKVDTSSIRSNGGIGLTLAVCKQIIDAHGGKLWYDIPTDGVKISFTLPK